MQTPNPTPMITTPGSTTEDRAPQVTRQMYTCVAHHNHEDQSQGLDEHINMKSLNRSKLGRTITTRIPMQQKKKKWSDWYPNGSPKFTNHQVPRKPKKIGRHAKRSENPKFWKNSKIKTHLAFGFKNPKNPKIKEIRHRMQKRPA